MSLSHRIYFTILLPKGLQPVLGIWKSLTEYLSLANALPNKFEMCQIAGHSEDLRNQRRLILSPDEVDAIIAERALSGFSVYTPYGERQVNYMLTEITDPRFPENEAIYFGCSIARKARAPANWAPLIESLLNRMPSTGAWQYMIRYQAWQWSTVKNEFYESNFGPFPLGYKTYPVAAQNDVGRVRTFINISMNPGRSKSLWPDHSYFRFHPTAEMWLGPHFWQYAKCTKEEALAADFFIEKRDTPHFLYLKCWPTAFTRPDGEQGRMQQRLWKLFFHEDCEWPPGSGTICDEPMYGPPELLPPTTPQPSFRPPGA